MHRPRLHLWALAFLVATLAGIVTAAPLPSAAAFDEMFKRLEFGDLSELDTPRQRDAVAQLQQLLPPGDAHRQRLLDTEHCSLDFVNAVNDGYAFADAKLAEALLAMDDAASVRFYYCRSFYLSSLNKTVEAMADVNRGIDLSRARNDETMLAYGLNVRGGVYSFLGVYGKALADLLEAQRLFTRNELDIAASQTLQSIGVAYRRLGYPDKAREYLNQSVEREKRVGDHEALFGSIVQLGFADQETGHFDSALATQRQALEIAKTTGDRQNIGAANLALGSVFTDLHRYPDALTALQQATADFGAAGDVSNDGMIAFQRGRALAGLGQHRDAIEAFKRAETTPDIAGNPRYEELLRQAKAESLEASGKPVQALTEYKRYVALHDENQHQRAGQQAQMLREQFDTDRSNLENARLKAEQMLTDRQVEALQRVRRWQQVAMGLLAVLLGSLVLLVVRQVMKLRVWQRMATVDPLTGVANRRGVEQFANAAIRHARAHKEPLAVLALDLDHFKNINDSFGHAAGDRALQHIARACQLVLRDGDLLGRMGGEEFLVVLPGSALDDAADVAERLRGRIEALRPQDLPQELTTTVSIGVAEMTMQDTGFGDLEHRADEALYQAKALGRNRVVGGPAVGLRGNQERGAPATTAGAAAAATGNGTASR